MAADEEPPETLSEPLMDFSNIGRTADGSGFAYRSVACAGKRVATIKAIETYAHAQQVDLSNNLIKEIAPLRGLEHVLKLNLARNHIANLKAFEPPEGAETMPFLRELDLSDNQLAALVALPFKALETASFARNEIASCQDFGGHATLAKLDLSGNKLSDLAGLAGLPALTSLEVSANELTSLNGLAEVPALAELRLARNPMESLEGPWQELSASPLALLDVSACQLASPQALEVLRHLPLLRSLEVAGNPFVESAGAADVGARVEVLVCHWRLKTLDGQPVTAEETEQARAVNVRRLEEKAKQAAEREAEGEAGEEA